MAIRIICNCEIVLADALVKASCPSLKDERRANEAPYLTKAAQHFFGVLTQTRRGSPYTRGCAAHAYRWAKLAQLAFKRMRHIQPALGGRKVWVGQQVVELHHGHDGNVVCREVFHPLGAGARAHVLAHHAIKRVDVFKAIRVRGKACVGLKQIRLTHEF